MTFSMRVSGPTGWSLPNHISRGAFFYLLSRHRAVAIAKFSGITMGIVPEWPTTIQVSEISPFTLDRLIDWLVDGLIDWMIDWLTDWLMDHVQLSYNQVASYLKHWFFHCPSFWGISSASGSKTRWRGSTERREYSVSLGFSPICLQHWAQRTAFHLFLGFFLFFKPPTKWGEDRNKSGKTPCLKTIWNTVKISFSFNPGLLQRSWSLVKYDFSSTCRTSPPGGRRCFIPVASMSSGRHTLRMKMSSPSKWWTTSPTRSFLKLLELGWRWWRGIVSESKVKNGTP